MINAFIEGFMDSFRLFKKLIRNKQFLISVVCLIPVFIFLPARIESQSWFGIILWAGVGFAHLWLIFDIVKDTLEELRKPNA